MRDVVHSVQVSQMGTYVDRKSINKKKFSNQSISRWMQLQRSDFLPDITQTISETIKRPMNTPAENT